jgi:hypothetical protein
MTEQTQIPGQSCRMLSQIPYSDVFSTGARSHSVPLVLQPTQPPGISTSLLCCLVASLFVSLTLPACLITYLRNYSFPFSRVHTAVLGPATIHASRLELVFFFPYKNKSKVFVPYCCCLTPLTFCAIFTATRPHSTQTLQRVHYFQDFVSR